jgi:hypothetical protein
MIWAPYVSCRHAGALTLLFVSDSLLIKPAIIYFKRGVDDSDIRIIYAAIEYSAEKFSRQSQGKSA